MAPAQIEGTEIVIEGTVTNTKGDFFEQIISEEETPGFFVHKTGPDDQGKTKVLIHQTIAPGEAPWTGLDGKNYVPTNVQSIIQTPN